MNILHGGKVFKINGRLIVCLVERSSKNGWDCTCLKDCNPRGYDYSFQMIFVFDEDLKEAEPVEFK